MVSSPQSLKSFSKVEIFTSKSLDRQTCDPAGFRLVRASVCVEHCGGEGARSHPL